MKKIFGFFQGKHKGISVLKVSMFLGAVALLVVFTVGIISHFTKGDINLHAVSKTLNTYEISLEYNSNNSFKASQKLHYKNTTNQTLDHLMFNLYPSAFSNGAINKPVGQLNKEQAYPNGESYGGIEIESVTINSSAVEFERQGEDRHFLKVVLPQTLNNGSNIVVDIQFSFALPNINHRFGYGDNAINVANFYPILGVFENGAFLTNPYNSNGDPFYSDMSNYKVSLTVPNKMVVAHTGKLVKTAQNENSKTLQINALAVRDFAFVMSEKFQVLTTRTGNTEIMYYYYNDENAQESLNVAKESIETFNELFGKYPYETYSVVQTNFLHGGMEYPNLVYISDSIEKKSDYQNVIIHETAHQWWYQLVGSNAYTTPWLDEGLTEFSTVLFYEKNPHYNVNSSELVANATSSYISFIELCESILGSVDTSMNRALNQYDTEPEYVYMTYVKGMLLFENLRDLIGHKNFETGLKKYFKISQFKNVTPEVLIKCFESASGRNLESFFTSWIDGKVLIKNFS